ncbi:MAG: immunoglobulin domain-containing protein [Anaerohalosphaera sp.]|nr:immunoglobulin domain-containing protein [Anaerohalosphaera sp.]
MKKLLMFLLVVVFTGGLFAADGDLLFQDEFDSQEPGTWVHEQWAGSGGVVALYEVVADADDIFGNGTSNQVLKLNPVDGFGNGVISLLEPYTETAATLSFDFIQPAEEGTSALTITPKGTSKLFKLKIQNGTIIEGNTAVIGTYGTGLVRFVLTIDIVTDTVTLLVTGDAALNEGQTGIWPTADLDATIISTISVSRYRINTATDTPMYIENLTVTEGSEPYTPNKCTSPEPTGAYLVETTSDISWAPPQVVIPDGYTLYLRPNDPNFHEPGNIVNGESVTPVEPRTTYALDTLAFNTTYYWRVDVVVGADPAIEGYVWNFTTLPETPVVTVDPVSQTVEAGTEVTFSIDHQNATSFQWYHGDDAISGATDESHVIASVQESDEGFYTCKAINGAGDKKSAAALLMTERLVARWEFEGDLTDTVDGLAGVVIDPNAANTLPPDMGYETGIVDGGQALRINTDLETAAVDETCVEIPGTEETFKFYLQGFTTSAWLNTAVGGRSDIVSKYSDAAGEGWSLAKSNGGGLFVVEELLGTGGGGAVADSEWHQVVATYDPVAQEAKVYVDGMLAAQRTGVATAETIGSTVKIGALDYDLENNSIANEFIGLIDDVRIYSYALDSVTIAKDYTDVAGGTICVDRDGLDFDVAGPEVDEEGNPIPDCIVDLYDFAVFAADWLNCRIVPTCIVP